MEITSEHFEGLRQSVLSHPMGGFALPVHRKLEDLERVHALGVQLKGEVDAWMVVGIGGSAIGIAMLGQVLGELNERLYVFDHLNLDKFVRVYKGLQGQGFRVGLAAISKSGGTVETMTLLNEIERHRDLEFSAQIFMTENKPSPLFESYTVAKSKHQRVEFLEIPVSVGGRFSIFCPISLPFLFFFSDISPKQVKAALDTVDERDGSYQLLKDLRQAAAADRFWLWTYSDRLSGFGKWFQQLWCESLGKPHAAGPIGTGPTPAVIPMDGPAGQHSVWQMVVGQAGLVSEFHWVISGQDSSNRALETLRKAERDSLLECLDQTGTPRLKSFLEEDSRADQVAQWIELCQQTMMAVAVLGIHLGINPFDQPGVEGIKVMIKANLQKG